MYSLQIFLFDVAFLETVLRQEIISQAKNAIGILSPTLDKSYIFFQCMQGPNVHRFHLWRPSIPARRTISLNYWYTNRRGFWTVSVDDDLL
jgi:hypothetical protein